VRAPQRELHAVSGNGIHASLGSRCRRGLGASSWRHARARKQSSCRHVAATSPRRVGV